MNSKNRIDYYKELFEVPRAGLQRIDKSVQFTYQKQIWVKCFEAVKDWDHSKTTVLLSSLLAAERLAYQENEWGKSPFSGCIVRGGVGLKDGSCFDCCRPVLLTNRGRIAAGLGPKDPILVTPEVMSLIGIDTQAGYDGASVPPLSSQDRSDRKKRAVANVARDLDGLISFVNNTQSGEFYTPEPTADSLESTPLIMSGRSPFERLKDGDGSRNLPFDLCELLLFLIDGNVSQGLLSIAMCYVALCMGTVHAPDISWSETFQDVINVLKGGSGLVRCPLDVQKPVRQNFEPFSMDGLYSGKFCESPFPDRNPPPKPKRGKVVRSMLDEVLPFIESKDGVRFSPSARTTLDYTRVAYCAFMSLDILLSRDLSSAVGYEDGEHEQLYMEVLTRLWNVGDRDVKKVNGAITTIMKRSSGWMAPKYCYDDGSYMMCETTEDPDIQVLMGKLLVKEREGFIDWEVTKGDVREATFPGSYANAVEKLSEIGLPSWVRTFERLRLAHKSTLACSLFFEPLACLGYTVSDANYELISPTIEDLPNDGGSIGEEAMHDYMNLVDKIIDAATNRTEGSSLRDAISELSKSMTTDKSAGGTHVRIELDVAAAAALHYRDDNNKPLEGVRIRSTGKALVLAINGDSLLVYEELTRVGTVDDPNKIAVRNVAGGRNTRLVFMVPVTTQLALTFLYWASKKVMSSEVTIGEVKHGGRMFVPASGVRNDIEKAGPIYIGANCCLWNTLYVMYATDFSGMDRHSILTQLAFITKLLERNSGPVWGLERVDGSRVLVPYTHLAGAAMFSTTKSVYNLTGFRPGTDGDDFTIRLTGPKGRRKIVIKPLSSIGSILYEANASGAYVTERVNSLATAIILGAVHGVLLVNGDDSWGFTHSAMLRETLEKCRQRSSGLGQNLEIEDAEIGDCVSFLRIWYSGFCSFRRNMSIDGEGKEGDRVDPFTVGSILSKVDIMASRKMSYSGLGLVRPWLLAISSSQRVLGIVNTLPDGYWGWGNSLPTSFGPTCSMHPEACLDYPDLFELKTGRRVSDAMLIPKVRNQAAYDYAAALTGLNSSRDISNIKMTGHGIGDIHSNEFKGEKIVDAIKRNLIRPLQPEREAKSNVVLGEISSAVLTGAMSAIDGAIFHDVAYSNSYKRQTMAILSNSLIDDRVKKAYIENLWLKEDELTAVNITPVSTRHYSVRKRQLGTLTLVRSSLQYITVRLEYEFEGVVINKEIQLPRILACDQYDLKIMFMHLFGFGTTPYRHQNVFPTSRPDISESDYLRLVRLAVKHGDDDKLTYNLDAQSFVNLLGLPDTDLTKVESLFSSRSEVVELADLISVGSYVTDPNMVSINAKGIEKFELLYYNNTFVPSAVEQYAFEKYLMSYTWSVACLMHDPPRTPETIPIFRFEISYS